MGNIPEVRVGKWSWPLSSRPVFQASPGAWGNFEDSANDDLHMTLEGSQGAYSAPSDPSMNSVESNLIHILHLSGPLFSDWTTRDSLMNDDGTICAAAVSCSAPLLVFPGNAAIAVIILDNENADAPRRTANLLTKPLRLFPICVSL